MANLQSEFNTKVVKSLYFPESNESKENQYLRKKVIKHYDPKNVKFREHNYNEDEKIIDEILENNYLENNTNVTIYILDLINTKYTNHICTLFKNILKRLNMENKFPSKT